MEPRTVCTVFAAAFFLSCVTVRAWLCPRPVPEVPPAPASPLPGPAGDAGVPSFPAWFEGPVVRALSVAMNDLVMRNGNPNSPDELVSCLSRTEAYDAQVVREADDRWTIYVRPQAERCFDGGARLKGGDAKYEISKKDFSIISAEFGE